MKEGLHELLASSDAESIRQGVELALALEDLDEVREALQVLEERELPTHDWAKLELLCRAVGRWPELRPRAQSLTHAQWWGAPAEGDVSVLLELPNLRYVMVSGVVRNLDRLAELSCLHTLELYQTEADATLLEKLRERESLHSLFFNEVVAPTLVPLRGARLGAFRMVSGLSASQDDLDLESIQHIEIAEELEISAPADVSRLGELRARKIALRYMTWDAPVSMPMAVDVAIDEVGGSLHGLAECIPRVEKLLLDMCPDALDISGFQSHPTLRELEIRRMRATVEVGPDVKVTRY